MLECQIEAILCKKTFQFQTIQKENKTKGVINLKIAKI